MKLSRALVLALLAFVALSAVVRAQDAEEAVIDEDDEEEVEDRAYLLVRRAIPERSLVELSPFTVNIDVHNAGTSDAKHVSVEDGEWAKEFEVTGKTTASYQSIPPGATVTLSYTVRPKVAATVQQRPVLVRYAPDETAPSAVVTTSSTWTPVRVATRLEHMRGRAVAAGAALTLGAVATEAAWARVVGVLLAAAAARVLYGLYLNLREAGRTSRRNAALASLGIKDE